MKNKYEQFVKTEIDMALKNRAIEVLKNLNIKENDRILDVGCGWGYYLNMICKLISKKKVKLYGLDRHAGSIKNAEDRLKNSCNIELVEGDVCNMPFRNSHFNTVIASELIEHVDDDFIALKEIYRVLKKGGEVIITVPNSNYPFFWDPLNWLLTKFFKIHIKNGLFAGMWAKHERLYSYNEVTSLLQKSKFKIKKAYAITRWCVPFNHLLLYGNKLPKTVSSSLINEFDKGSNIFTNIILKLLNAYNNLNDIFPAKKVGTNLIFIAEK